MRKTDRPRPSASRGPAQRAAGEGGAAASRHTPAFTRTAARCASAVLLAGSLVLAAPAPSSYAGASPAQSSGSRETVAEGCDEGPAACHGGVKWLYRYNYSLGVHPFTSPHEVRRQLTDHFWLFPVSGACPARIRPADECDLLGGNPVRVEAVGATRLQIATLPGHDLGDGLHIRFAFSRTFGFHYLAVSAWQDRPTRCTRSTPCAVASRAGAWALWKVLSATLAVTAYAA
ncbi:hypothetical protein [Streptomyces sp. NBC_00385]|uniref:hypothetical protein n=1 Tax=Streptomyces sp. NBC_00385 TaxID=2975733 RepID=UPI002DD93D3C|nr:hypothetical protein [Streptomyces sp. NBC_00385]WRZ08525.1 hypothetical protein OG959_36845 [Streptomyces sp. NBC_00385]